MPRKKLQDETPSVPIVFRVPENLLLALQRAAQGLNLDVSGVLRMIVTEHVPEYIERGSRAAMALEQANETANRTTTARSKPSAGNNMRRRTILTDESVKPPTETAETRRG